MNYIPVFEVLMGCCAALAVLTWYICRVFSRENKKDLTRENKKDLGEVG